MAELATIARPYAEALFKATSKDLNGAAVWVDALSAVAQNAQLQQFADSPKASTGQVFDLIAGVAKVDLPDAAKNFLRTVIENGRLNALPDVPTLLEMGVPGVELTQWYALFAPSGTSPEIVEKINQTLNEVLNDADVRARMSQDGAQVKTSTPQQLSRHVQSEILRWRKVIASTGLSSQHPLEAVEA